MCEFHESTCNGFGDIWWTDNPIYFSSIDDARYVRYLNVQTHDLFLECVICDLCVCYNYVSLS